MTQKEWIQPSPLLHHVWDFTAAHPWWFSGYQTTVVAPALGLGHTTGAVPVGPGNVSWYQRGFSSGTTHQSIALTTGTISGWQVPLSLRGQRGFRELATLAQNKGHLSLPFTNRWVPSAPKSGLCQSSLGWRELRFFCEGIGQTSLQHCGEPVQNPLAASMAVGGLEFPAWIVQTLPAKEWAPSNSRHKNNSGTDSFHLWVTDVWQLGFLSHPQKFPGREF